MNVGAIIKCKCTTSRQVQLKKFKIQQGNGPNNNTIRSHCPIEQCTLYIEQQTCYYYNTLMK